jgi:hypothetical protein
MICPSSSLAHNANIGERILMLEKHGNVHLFRGLLDDAI